MSEQAPIRDRQILIGALFSEPMRVETVRPNGTGSWLAGLVGTETERFRSVSLTAEDLAGLTISGSRLSYDADGRLLRLGLEAHALGIAHEFDPYFGLSISRVDPLPHQLEAVYGHLLKLSTVRFLLADDAGAGGAAAWIESGADADNQTTLFPELDAAAQTGLAGPSTGDAPSIDALLESPDATALDRVHAAMLLQAGGHANALRTLIVSEQDRGSDFLRLSNALSALYPRGSRKKRLLDAMLLAVPR